MLEYHGYTVAKRKVDSGHFDKTLVQDSRDHTERLLYSAAGRNAINENATRHGLILPMFRDPVLDIDFVTRF